VVRRTEPLVPDRDHRRFCNLVRTAFAADRPVGGHLLGAEGKRAARRLGVGRTARARDLDVHQWAAVFAAVRRTG
jgi:hypothetical protein